MKSAAPEPRVAAGGGSGEAKLGSCSLLIGYGNPFRRDDGAGRVVADALAAELDLGFTIRSVRLLTPELAAELASYPRVVFVDSTLEALSEVRLTRLVGTESDNPLGHALEPSGLLGLAADVYGARPEAWMMRIPGHDFGWGDGLSDQTARCVADAVAWLKELQAVAEWPGLICPPGGGETL